MATEAEVIQNLQDIEVGEPLLDPRAQPQQERDRKTAYPIIYKDLYKFYQKQVSSIWLANEIIIQQKDIDDFNSLTENEQYFIKHVLGFFAASDTFVIENISLNMLTKVQNLEVKSFYTAQMMIEGVHNEVYSKLIEEHTTSKEERDKLLDGINEFPGVQKKADWAIKWLQYDTSFHKRVIAWMILEGIFFASSFNAIFWLKERGIMPALTTANELIQRDESLHADFAVALYNHLHNKLDEKTVKDIFTEALDIEKEFVCESLPVSLLGMNSHLMCRHLEHRADQLLKRTGYTPMFNVEDPLRELVEKNSIIASECNFFEKREVNYSLGDMNDKENFDMNEPDEVDF